MNKTEAIATLKTIFGDNFPERMPLTPILIAKNELEWNANRLFGK
jgi:hypothetical protein